MKKLKVHFHFNIIFKIKKIWEIARCRGFS